MNNSIELYIPHPLHFTDEQFLELCQANPDLRLEQKATGELIIMHPTGGETGKQNSGIIAQLWLWNQTTKLGEVFDSSTGFNLPNGSKRAPDAAWISQENWNQITLEQRKKFPPLCPDFAVELRSPNDNLLKLQSKMQEYVNNGMRLGWLINPENKQVEIYRKGQPKEILNQPRELSGEELLPGFILDLEAIGFYTEPVRKPSF